MTKILKNRWLMGVVIFALILTTGGIALAQENVTVLSGGTTVVTNGQTGCLYVVDGNMFYAAGVECPNGEPAEANPGTPGDDSDLAECPTAFEASRLMGVNEEALVRESNPPAEYCLFEIRLPQGTTNATVKCPDGWNCAIDTAGKNGHYYVGGDGTHELDHKTPGASWRLRAAYPATDPLNTDPCIAMANEQTHVDETSPESNFRFIPGNFECEETSGPNAAPDTWTVGVCPSEDQAKEVAQTIGGRAKEWKLTHNDDDQLIWKRQRASTPAKVAAPWGTLDVWDGHNAHMGVTEANKAYEMTWNCEA